MEKLKAKNGITLMTLTITLTVLVLLIGVTTIYVVTNTKQTKVRMYIAKLEEIYTEISQYASTNNIEDLKERDAEITHPIQKEKIKVKELSNAKLENILKLGEFTKIYLSYDNTELFGKIKNNNLTYEGVPLYVKGNKELASNFRYDRNGELKTPELLEAPKPKVGDIVIYDPTRGVRDTSKLTYTSSQNQNGYGYQTITATSNHKEWVVISTSGGQVKMMSKEPIDGIEGGKDENGNTKAFVLHGGKGYLYAEEELHKMCSVFGHGKGAGKITTKYTVGNPYIGEEEQRTLTGSGARSLTIEDIVKIMKGDNAKDFTDEEKKGSNSGYKKDVSPEVYYPTKVSTEENRESDDKKSFIEDFYGIHKEQYTNYAKSETKTAREALANGIFIKDKVYWYGFRCVSAYSSDACFYVGTVYSSIVLARNLFCRRCRLGRSVFCGVWPKTCGLLGLFRPIREDWLRK